MSPRAPGPHCERCPAAAGTYCTGQRLPGYCRDRAAEADRPPAPEPPLPRPARVAIAAAQAAGRAVVAVATGTALLAPEGLAAARLAVCRGGGDRPACDRYRPSDDRCAKCGCHLGKVGGKARLLTEDCPLGRWPAIPGESS